MTIDPERIETGARLAREILARDLLDPLWPGLTESDWSQDAKAIAEFVLEVVREVERARWVEKELRREWWLNHGHPFHALYGDDGEMQCQACPHDFKRDPIDDLRHDVMVHRAALANPAAEETQ